MLSRHVFLVVSAFGVGSAFACDGLWTAGLLIKNIFKARTPAKEPSEKNGGEQFYHFVLSSFMRIFLVEVFGKPRLYNLLKVELLPSLQRCY